MKRETYSKPVVKSEDIEIGTYGDYCGPSSPPPTCQIAAVVCNQ